MNRIPILASLADIQFGRRAKKCLGSLLGLFVFSAVVNAAPGELDPGFGVDGISITGVGPKLDLQTHGRSAVIQADGKIVIAGYVENNRAAFSNDFALARYNTDGTLDTGFGNGGIVITGVGPDRDWGNAVIQQADGKLVVAGYTFENRRGNGFALVRYNADGSLDKGFGNQGAVVTRLEPNSIANALIQQPDGKLVIAGKARNAGGHDDFALARYDQQGNLDPTFGGDGVVTTDLGAAGNDEAFSLVIQPADGKLVVAGYREESSGARDFALARYESNGQLDTNFGTNGIVITPVGLGGESWASSLIQQADSRLVAVGRAFNGAQWGGQYDLAVVRYEINGNLDSSFGGDGIVITNKGGGDYVGHGLVQQSDGRLVVAGTYSSLGDDFAVTRFEVDGSRDTSFGYNGWVEVEATVDGRAFALALQKDGRSVVAGSHIINYNSSEFQLARLSASGHLDTGFGDGGKVFTAATGTLDFARSAVQQADGKMVVAGYSHNGNNYDFTLARYNEDGSLDISFGSQGAVVTNLWNSSDYAQAITQQADGKLVAAGYSYVNGRDQFSLARYHADGSIDAQFGTDGIVTTGVGSSSSYARAIIQQSDGKLVVAGEANNGSHNDVAIVRYNNDGSRDSSFGAGGIIMTDISGSHDYAYSLIQQEDGRLVVAGAAIVNGNRDVVLLRFGVNGVPDPEFGNNGVVVTNLGDQYFIRSLIQQADGKLVGAGKVVSTDSTDFALVRYHSDGILDSGFGNGGIVRTEVVPGGSGEVSSVIQQVDGGLVAGGTVRSELNGDVNDDFALVRYEIDGGIDATFGSAGKVLIGTGISEAARSLHQQSDGKFVLAGSTARPNEFMLARVLNGEPPVADSGSPYSIAEGTSLVLDASASSDPDGTIASYAWDLDNDGDFTDASGATVDLGIQPDDVATYTIGLRVMDNDGNTDTATTTVTVTNVAPTANGLSVAIASDSSSAITLNGNDVSADTLTFNVATPPGNGTLSGSGAELVYTPKAGYAGSDSFTFTATDDDGGVSAPATVSITVTDQTAPVITLLGSATMTLEAGTAYSDPGAIASDNVDDDITGSINVSGSVDTGRVGMYTVTYSVSDAAGNGDTEQRSISVVDTTAPLVSAPGNRSIDVVDQSELSSSNPAIASFLDSATASDIVDGSLPVANDAPAQLSIGSNLITFSATDAADNTGSAQSTLTITSADQDFDGLPNHWEIEYGLDPDVDDAALDLDGDGRSNLDEYLEGGDPSLDDIAPVLTAPADLTVDSTGPLTPVDLGVAVASDYKDGDLVATVDNPGPYSPGAYTLIWSVSDAAGNTTTAEQQLIVLPQVSVAAEQSVAEGEMATVELLLNGEAASYPVTVPFTVSGTATRGIDYEALTGELVIESGTSGTLTVQTLGEPAFEGRETIVLTLQAPTNAVLGSAAEHTITLLEENHAPEVDIVTAQGSRITSTVAADGGAVEMLADVSDGNPDDVHLFDWSASDSSLVPAEGFASGSFTFAPASLPAGLYAVALQVTDNGVPPLSTVTETLLRVIATAPELSDSVDSDGDGLTDAEEGLEDADMDRIPDYLDAHTGGADGHLLPANAAGDLMQTEVGLRLRLGSTAYAAGHPYAEVGQAEIASFGGLAGNPGDNAADDPMAYYAGIFDFEVFGLQPGAAADVVIPQGKPLLGVSGYRKYVAGMGWFDFVEDANNFIASAPGLPGICPAPGDDAYTPGIASGHHCLQLTIQDGGPNDADGDANGIIRDPGGAAADTSVAPQIQVEATMSDDLEVSAGEEVVVLAFSITSDSDDAEIHQFALAGSGSGNEVEDIGEAALYQDQNGDGVPQEAEKIASVTYEADDGELLFSLPEPQQIPVGQSNYLVVYQF